MNAGNAGSGEKSDLPRLSEEETQAIYDEAHRARKVTMPWDLRASWAHRQRMRGREGVMELVRIARTFAASPELDDPSNAAGFVARMIEQLVSEFEWAVSSGAFDDVLPRMAGLPVLYSPRAGKGSPEWAWAHSMFDSKDVASNALTIHISPDFDTARNRVWSLLACEVVRLIAWAAMSFDDLDALRKQAVAIGRKVAKRKGGHLTWEGKLYVLADGRVLIWPVWLDLCKELPNHPREALEGYQRAGCIMLRGFFGDPNNAHAQSILARSVEGPARPYPAHARRDAIRMVLDAIERVVP